MPPHQKKDPFDVKHASNWDVKDVGQWLISIGFNECGQYFTQHKINGLALLMLDEEDVKEIIRHNVGDRKNLYHIIRCLQIRYNRYMNKANSDSFFGSTNSEDSESESGEESIKPKQRKIKKNYLLSDNNANVSYDEATTPSSKYQSHLKPSSIIHRHLVSESKSYTSSPNILKNKKSSPQKDSLLNEYNSDSKFENMPNFCENCLKKFDSSPYSAFSQANSNDPIRCYRGEKRKTAVSMLYLFVIGMWTSFVLTVVHDRVPDMQKYPPLPDLILDNVPLIPWAFFASEAIGIALLTIVFIILTFHKYRMIIFRRMCSLGGTIFLLRSITMLITSLSVPGDHIECKAARYGSLENKLYGAWNILSGVGLYASGVRTCGDYMFSGHTVWLTLTAHFISEYTPTKMYWLHTLTWVMNLFGLFFILGSHEHYSIDVFVGFYITSRLFLYYHSLANNKALFQRDHRRVKIWFPMLSYFESNIHSIVPNEFHNPLHYGYKYVRSKFKMVRKSMAKTKTNGQLNKSHDN